MPPVTAPTLTDGLVTLRHPREDDVQGSWEQCQDPLSQQWTTVPIPYSHADARDFVLGFVPGAWESDTEWGFVVEVEGRYAGHVALRNEGNRRAEIAYGSHPWVRGTGHMERALRLLLDWGFADKELATVIWLANVGNWASRKLAWRLGFTVEGTLRQWLVHREELRDAWAGTLLREDPREPRGRWLDDVVLEGDGLRLRPFAEADVPRIVEACSDERTRRWLARMPSPYGEEQAQAFLERSRGEQAAGEGLGWAVTDQGSDLAVGAIDIFGLAEDLSSCEVGYWTHPDARGRGVMTRAVGLVLEHAFETLGVRRVQAHAAVANAASRHVLERSGMVQQGLARLGTFTADGRADAVVYDVLREEWAAGSPPRARTAETTSTANPASASAAPTTPVER